LLLTAFFEKFEHGLTLLPHFFWILLRRKMINKTRNDPATIPLTVRAIAVELYLAF
jgi:hypothetical protein